MAATIRDIIGMHQADVRRRRAATMPSKVVLRTAASIAYEEAEKEVAAFAKVVGHRDKVKPARMVAPKRKK